MWGLPERPKVEIQKGGAVLTIRLSPDLLKALQAGTDEAMVDHLVLRILNDWAGITEVSTTTPETGTFVEHAEEKL